MRDMFYDRSGIPISARDFERLHMDMDYRVVARTTITDAADPAKTLDVSTVWLGLNHGFGDSPPLIFETMVFGDDSLDLSCGRYSTEDEAKKGHVATVIVVTLEMTDPVIMDKGE